MFDCVLNTSLIIQRLFVLLIESSTLKILEIFLIWLVFSLKYPEQKLPPLPYSGWEGGQEGPSYQFFPCNFYKRKS